MDIHRILVVDDTRTSRRFLVSLLCKFGMEVVEAENGLVALEILEKQNIDLVLLDIEMPELDGREVLRILKDREMLYRLPVLMISSLSDTESVVQCIEMGATDYLVKPFNASILKARVLGNLDRKRLIDQNYRVMERLGNLVHILCHDLANPLAVVRMGTEIALEDLSDDGRVDLAEVIVELKKSDRAAGTISDIIEHIKQTQALVDGKTIVAFEDVNVLQLLRQAQFVFGARLSQKGLEIESNFTDFPELTVRAEKVSLGNSVINNLISNAIKFSKPGSKIILNVSLGDEVTCIKVRDVGIGIPENILMHIFSGEKATSRPGTSGEKGTGFGMPLVKAYVESYGGRIEIESKTAENGADPYTEVRLYLKSK